VSQRNNPRSALVAFARPELPLCANYVTQTTTLLHRTYSIHNVTIVPYF
jgi:hypothetical protein